MISSLGTATPTLVIGWSHKYLEVLAQFNQDDVAIDYHDLNVEAVMEKCDHLLANRDQRSAEIAASLPSVLASSRSGLASVFELIS
jgi:polysaccharide pyruvyl transferase WcaK-like protein